jgi:hypothetical protein
MEACTYRLKVVPWRVCRPVVAYLPHFEEGQDPGPDPHQSEKSDPDLNHPSEKSDPDPHRSKRGNRIRIDLMRIRNTAEVWA